MSNLEYVYNSYDLPKLIWLKVDKVYAFEKKCKVKCLCVLTSKETKKNNNYW